MMSGKFQEVKDRQTYPDYIVPTYFVLLERKDLVKKLFFHLSGSISYLGTE